MIYLARDGDYIKIGLAKQSNLLRRWIELQIGNPRDILFRVYDAQGEMTMERELQARFAHRYVRGEWYLIDDELEGLWAGSTEVEARKLMGRPPDKRKKAVEWLKDRLSDGPLLASIINAEGAVEGFSRKTLYRAANELGIRRDKDGKQTVKIVWELP